MALVNLTKRFSDPGDTSFSTFVEVDFSNGSRVGDVLGSESVTC